MQITVQMTKLNRLAKSYPLEQWENKYLNFRDMKSLLRCSEHAQFYWSSNEIKKEVFVVG